MNSAPSSWTLRRKPSFAKDLKRLAKDLYKSDRQRQDFLKFVVSFVEVLEHCGPSCPQLDARVMAGVPAPKGCKLYKFYLRPPETRGASGEMRVLALVNEADRVIELLMTYTHADYPNPSCYPSIFWAMRPRLWARTKESTLMTKPSWVTA